jgi:hypothetical protein
LLSCYLILIESQTYNKLINSTVHTDSQEAIKQFEGIL